MESATGYATNVHDEAKIQPDDSTVECEGAAEGSAGANVQAVCLETTTGDEEQLQESAGNDNKKRQVSIPYRLYASRALSAWSDRLWQFGGGLFMVTLGKGNLRLVSIFGLCIMASNTLFGAHIGDWIDRKSRLFAACTFLLLQNTMTMICCAIFACYFGFELPSGSWIHNAIAPVTIMIATSASLASLGCKTAVEKDWIPVIAGGDQEALAIMNSRFRALDLLCNLLAPTLTGAAFYIGSVEASVFIGAWNVLSGPLEYKLLVDIFKQVPALATKPLRDNSAKDDKPSWWSSTKRGWSMYLRHPVRNAGLGLGLVYMTVLGFDNITYAYVLGQCVPQPVLGALVGISSFVGIGATAVFPALQRSHGLGRAGLVGISWMILCLSACVISVWLPGSPFDAAYYQHPRKDPGLEAIGKGENEACHTSSFLSVVVMLGGIVLARFGLWTFDMSVSAIMQLHVEESVRGIMGGVQSALQNIFDIIKFLLAISLPYEETFGWLVIASFTCIVSAGISFALYVCKASTQPA